MATLNVTPNTANVGDQVEIHGSVNQFDPAKVHVTSDTGYDEWFWAGVWAGTLAFSTTFKPDRSGKYTLVLSQDISKGHHTSTVDEATATLTVN